jgi:copper(I)-binding protein
MKVARLLAVVALAAAQGALAHEFRAGDVRITHPYAPPAPPGAANGAAYVATLENRGRTPDRVMRASSPIAERVELHVMSVDAAGVMRMREVADIPLPPRAPLKMRPGEGYHFMLVGLKRPLAVGDRFPLLIEFERGGRAEVSVWVQQPRQRSSTSHNH